MTFVYNWERWELPIKPWWLVGVFLWSVFVCPGLIRVLYEVQRSANVMILSTILLAADAWLKLLVLCRDAVWMLPWLQWLITLMDQKDILIITMYAFPLFTLFFRRGLLVCLYFWSTLNMSYWWLIPGRCDPRESSWDSGKAEKGWEAAGKSNHHDLFCYCQCFRYSATLLRKHPVFILYFSCKTVPFFSICFQRSKCFLKPNIL